MPLFRASALPNIITIARVLAAPVVLILVFVPGFAAQMVAFTVFVVAAVSDLWDGYLARKHGWISDFGQLVDPIADKLLLVATFVPFYILSHRDAPVGALPWIGELPLWIVILIFAREVLVTVLRSIAANRGLILPAGRAGKQKAVFQNIFIGSLIFWYALQSAALERLWSGPWWERWQAFHGGVVMSTLAVAVLLTLQSLVIYLRSWKDLRGRAA
ncbi:MAG: CDP-alcohol phosphatidyltransferase family protein [Longimicrobiales bacterium]